MRKLVRALLSVRVSRTLKERFKRVQPRHRCTRFEALEARYAPAVFNLVGGIADGAPGSLREAISQANDLDGEHVINLGAGAYVISLVGRDDDSNQSGDFDLTNPATTISIIGAGAYVTYIDAQGIDRAIQVFPGVTVHVIGVEIFSGSTRHFDIDGGYGGAISNAGNFTLEESRLSSSNAVGGGGIYNSGVFSMARSSIDRTTTTPPPAVGKGGGIYNAGTFEITESSITGAQAAPWGGGIFNTGTLHASESSITDNLSQDGGGVHNAGGTLVIERCNVSNNMASYGGAIFSSSGSVTVENSAVLGNGATGDGGNRGTAFRFYGTTTTIRNTTVSRNGPVSESSVIDNLSGSLDLENCTFSENFLDHDADAAGGDLISTSGGTTTYLKNNIFWNNLDLAGSFFDIRGGTIVSLGGNFFRRVPPSFSPDPTDHVGVDPKLGLLQDNGGPTLTYALLSDSQARDAGITSGAPVTDQRGVARPQGTGIDSGAFELDDSDDGVSDVVEGGAPNGGDGNGDGEPDSEQANVASLPNAVSGEYVTLDVDARGELANVAAVTNPSAGGDLPAGTTAADFPSGFFEFQTTVAQGGSTTVVLILHAGPPPTTYFKYGPTPDEPTPHWYEFTYDGTTGAVISGNTITLHLVDGARGDDDLTANGVIVEPGGPATLTQIVQIEIKPGDAESTVNLASNGVIAVAILSTADFDAQQVAANSVIFAGSFATQSALEDVNGDGRLDMLLHFHTQETNLRAVYEQLLIDDMDADGVLDSTRQVASVSLSGETVDEVLIQGFDDLNLFLAGKKLRDLLEELFG